MKVNLNMREFFFFLFTLEVVGLNPYFKVQVNCTNQHTVRGHHATCVWIQPTDSTLKEDQNQMFKRKKRERLDL